MPAKAKGYTDDQGTKCYKIFIGSTEHYDLKPDGILFTDGTKSQQLKKWKQEAERAHREEPQPEQPEVVQYNTWNCVPPAALLALIVAGGEHREAVWKAQSLTGAEFDEVARTLDAYGLLTPEGLIDTEAANRELQGFLQRQALQADTDENG